MGHNGTMVIHNGKVHSLSDEEVGEKAYTLLGIVDDMHEALWHYLKYKYLWNASGQKEAELKAMMIDELRHTKYFSTKMQELMMQCKDCEEENVIIKQIANKA